MAYINVLRSLANPLSFLSEPKVGIPMKNLTSAIMNIERTHIY